MNKLIEGLRDVAGGGATVESVRRNYGPMVAEGLLSKGYAEQVGEQGLRITEAGQRALADA